MWHTITKNIRNNIFRIMSEKIFILKQADIFIPCALR